MCFLDVCKCRGSLVCCFSQLSKIKDFYFFAKNISTGFFFVVMFFSTVNPVF